MAYTELSEAASSLEHNHEALKQEISSSICPVASIYPLTSTGQQEQLSRQDALRTEFISNARAYLRACGKGENLVQQDSEKVIATVKEFTGEMEILEQGAILALMLFNLVVFALVITVLI